MYKRGDVVLVHIPYIELTGIGKRRPVVVVQRDEYNDKLPHVLIAAVTSRTRQEDDPTSCILDPSDSEGKAAGVSRRSLIRCDRIFTVDQVSIESVIGKLSFGSMARVDDCLRAALGLPAQAVPQMGNYEKWPGYLRVKERLDFLVAAYGLNASPPAFLGVQIQPILGGPIHWVAGDGLKVVTPAEKKEFVHAGNSIRVNFLVTHRPYLDQLAAILPLDFVKYPLHRASFWSYSVANNQVT